GRSRLHARSAHQKPLASDAQRDPRSVLVQQRLERELRLRGEARRIRAALHAKVERVLAAQPQRAPVERLFAAVRQRDDGRLITAQGHRLHEVGHVLHLEVRPVVAVVQDVAAVVGVPSNPARESPSHAGVLDARAVVPEAALRIEADRALTRAPEGRGTAEKLWVITGFHEVGYELLVSWKLPRGPIGAA